MLFQRFRRLTVPALGAAKAGRGRRALMDVPEREHLGKARLADRIEAALAHPCRRIFQSAKEPVDKREIRVIQGVPVALMMDTMRFGTLKQPAQPARRPDVPVI